MAPSASSAISDEPSPNASILPEPLGQKKSKEEQSEKEAPEEPVSPVVVPRPVPTALSQNEALVEDELIRGGVGAGYVAQARFVWPAMQSTLQYSGKKTDTWPLLEMELLRELPEQPARLRVVLSSPVFPLPMGTEIRMRADRIGALIVWPDRRSYRSAAPGTMSALFSDKRVDRLPFVEKSGAPPEELLQGGRKTFRHRLETTLGTMEMDLVEVSDLPYAPQLLCHLLLDMVRVAPDPEICKVGRIPTRLRASWKEGGSFLFEVLSYKKKPRIALDDLRMPPSLPIHKAGELPPHDEFSLPESLRRQVFPIKWGDFLPRPTPPPPTLPSQQQTPEGALPVVGSLAPDEVEVENLSSYSVLLQLDRLPYLWLGPGDKRHLRVRGAPVFYAARDFWGHLHEEPGLISAPAQVRFGAPKTEAGSP